jgi:hypothetical protein
MKPNLSSLRGVSAKDRPLPQLKTLVSHFRWGGFSARVLTFLLLALTIAGVKAQFAYTTNNGTITITQYTGPGGDVTIPATITGLPVTDIGTLAFVSITTVTNVTLPDSVTNIGSGAFSDCTKIASVSLGKGLINIGDQAFFNCTSLGKVTVPGSVTTIGYKSFYDCGLTSLSLANSVQSLGIQCFSFCGRLTSVTIPSSVVSIGELAFDSCKSLSAITVDPLNPSYSSQAGVLFDEAQTTLIQCPGAKAGTYAVPNGIINIGGSAFRNCNSLTNITIPITVTNIGSSAFGSISSLLAILVDPLNPFFSSSGGVLFDKIQTVLIQCPGALSGTYSVPNTVTNIISTAFVGCANITAITVDALNPYYSSMDGVLFDKAQSTLIQCPATLTGSYSIPVSVTIIGTYAFALCSSLTNVSIPPGVTSIGIGAFVECTSLASMIIPNTVTSIGSEAFEDCKLMSSVTIPESVTSIGSYAFAECSGLTNVTIPNSIGYIVDRAFQDCTSLVSVTIGSGVTNIGTLAFGFCPNLASFYFRGNAPTADLAALGDGTALVYYLWNTTGWGSSFYGLPTMVWNPQIQTDNASFGMGTNGFGFTITGPSNMVVIVEATVDLASSVWTAVQTNTLTDGSAYFNDPQSTNYPVRLYRLRSQ